MKRHARPPSDAGDASMQYIRLHLQPSTVRARDAGRRGSLVRWPRDKEGKHEIETIKVW